MAETADPTVDASSSIPDPIPAQSENPNSNPEPPTNTNPHPEPPTNPNPHPEPSTIPNPNPPPTAITPPPFPPSFRPLGPPILPPQYGSVTVSAPPVRYPLPPHYPYKQVVSNGFMTVPPPDVRGANGKTTLLHFVVLDIIRTEGIHASRMSKDKGSSISSIDSDDLSEDHSRNSKAYFHSLGFEVMSGLNSELENVKKAAGLDADALTINAASLGERLIHRKEFLKNKIVGLGEESKFLASLRGFVSHAESNITRLLEEEKRIRLMVKQTTDYFNGDTGKDEGDRATWNLRNLFLEESIMSDEKEVNWLHELATNNSVLQSLNFYMTELKISWQDLELISKNCKSPVLLKISDCDISNLVDFLMMQNH